MELMESNLASDVWLIGVPMVGCGGFVGPWVPVAKTPSGRDVAAEAPVARRRAVAAAWANACIIFVLGLRFDCS